MNSKKIILLSVALFSLISTFTINALIATKTSSTASQQISDEIQLSYEEDTFINDTAFNYIREIYSAIDFDSDFKSGDTEMYDFYKEQYLKLINCEAAFTEKNGKKEYYINEFGEMDYTDSGYILKHSL